MADNQGSFINGTVFVRNENGKVSIETGPAKDIDIVTGTDVSVKGVRISATDGGIVSLGSATITQLKQDSSGNTALQATAGKKISFTKEDGTEYWNVDTATGQLNQNSTNGSNLVFGKALTGVVNNVVTAITAAGAAQGTATALTGTVNRVDTVAAGANGVILPTPTVGFTIVACNNDAADSMTVYPASGHSINILSANTGLAVAAGKSAMFIGVSTTQWFAILSA